MKPRKLGPGSTIAIVSPASAIDRTEMEAGIKLLRGAGYRIRVMPHAAGRWRYLASCDEDRAADLTDAFLDPEVDAVLCARGGYGCARLMRHIDAGALAATGKLFIGYSDVTILHLALASHGLATLHAIMLGEWRGKHAPWVAASWLAALRGDLTTPAAAPTGECFRPGRADGLVTGGCLTLLCDAIGTPYAMDAMGKIVLIEDVGETARRVDAMLTHLTDAGALDGAAALVVGEMTDTDKVGDPERGERWRDVVADRLADIQVPVIWNFPFGHCGDARPLGLGARARVDADAGTMTYLEDLCE